ncbi:hypothetical protein HYPSUDRAFT_850510 [Hypholoma sublateritium FD-334 SS-4]|uniref:Uncharacterized protein n=1 Tax=Hypholoma sublateritium (strain FD-334 SS-4) TaxID=945553 RepID=A0A0D2M904_HYPSF|nr:hypothetical protein HYPSUDRAFT_850510 [Hypholoma sublateritium FD-334 SS-4]
MNMPSFTTLIEDTSPILIYSQSGWRSGTSETDGPLDQYTESSFALALTLGATMNFAFNGSGIALVGGMRPNHGTYSVTVDGTQSAPANGQSNTSLFNQTMFEDHSLQQGFHTLILTNEQGDDIDIDYVGRGGHEKQRAV